MSPSRWLSGPIVAHECRAINRTIARMEDWQLRDLGLIRQPERATDDNLTTALAKIGAIP
jgi:hypothetical protein